ncbi:hypothetical protein Mp_4g01820 [Marchantia polymorpha subsp. ruderalis]|uniref:Uncharacterized protein n=2 Tax=Marchantia polymorpha TaxID=3197 RepID=A0AAF6B5B2_MARPO|nr:hypothetical protein MARPO_0098s0018 [Marchantia polymorpha]BBN07196.1 hypothetical protein Mp_4g01820 [Marchantia polymorpha subsp. ruderalis]|eukprot:PTQ32463.1 hypothetical protein MARPO_0098s0018 [Marchantia polymorpha]
MQSPRERKRHLIHAQARGGLKLGASRGAGGSQRRATGPDGRMDDGEMAGGPNAGQPQSQSQRKAGAQAQRTPAPPQQGAHHHCSGSRSMVIVTAQSPAPMARVHDRNRDTPVTTHQNLPGVVRPFDQMLQGARAGEASDPPQDFGIGNRQLFRSTGAGRTSSSAPCLLVVFLFLRPPPPPPHLRLRLPPPNPSPSPGRLPLLFDRTPPLPSPPHSRGPSAARSE